MGVIEAPRGTLWHHYWVDENGQLEKVNLIVATGNNNWAMSKAVDSVAKTYVDGKNVTEGQLNRIEAAIRAYDPCLSCSTHALGQMPLEVVVYDRRGRRGQPHHARVKPAPTDNTSEGGAQVAGRQWAFRLVVSTSILLELHATIVRFATGRRRTRPSAPGVCRVSD